MLFHRFSSIANLIFHLQEEHQIEISLQNLKFTNLEDFNEWKAKEEQLSKAYYVQHTASKVYGDNTHWYLYCNRSGIGRSQSEGKRITKSQGSCKIGKTCCSFIKVSQNMPSGKVNVQYCSTHISHSAELAHLPIPSDTRKLIAAKLHEGVSIEKILDSVRDTLSNGQIGCEQIVSRQDICNIQRQLNIDSITKHSNDLLSTCAWVQEMEDMAYNPVLLFKPQGPQENDKSLNLSDDDFLLAIQTEFQKDAMLQFGKKVILMDATHGTTQYDFLLISVLVVDGHGEGVPVAWAISNKEDTNIISLFLQAIHSRIGDLETECFMSDCAEQYFNAWQCTFGGENTRKLLCIWHVDRAWRRALNDHVEEQQDKIEIYHQLCVLLQEREENQFMVSKVTAADVIFKQQLSQFYQYFNTQYITKVKEWATYFRIGTIVNTNMFVELFHRLLKVDYLKIVVWID